MKIIIVGVGKLGEYLAKSLVKPNDIIPMNYHFTTTKTHINMCGGTVVEVFTDEAIKITSDAPFKGDMDLNKLQDYDF